MIGRRFIAIAFLLVSCVSVRAEAKELPRVPDWEQSHLQEGNSAVISLYILAVCARNHRRDAVEALLASTPKSADEARLIPVVVPSGETDCPVRPGGVRVREKHLIRGAVAEAMYNGDKFKPKGDAALPLMDAYVAQSDDPSSGVSEWVAHCAVRRSPKLAHAVIGFNPGSIGERRALRALEPTFVGCLPAGQNLTASRLMVRMLLAEELYAASRSFKEAFKHA